MSITAPSPAALAWTQAWQMSRHPQAWLLRANYRTRHVLCAVRITPDLKAAHLSGPPDPSGLPIIASVPAPKKRCAAKRAVLFI